MMTPDERSGGATHGRSVRVGPDEPAAHATDGALGAGEGLAEAGYVEGDRIELREEVLVPRKETREVGEIVVRTEIEEVPGRLEVEAVHEEIEVEHVPVGEVVQERRSPWEDGDTPVVPVYEEQLVVSKRLVLKEQIRIRRTSATETRLFEERLRRERLVVEDNGLDVVRERYPADGENHAPAAYERHKGDGRPREGEGEGGFLEGLVRKALQ